MPSAGATAFSCQQCTKSFSRQEHLQRHVQRHIGLRPFPCAECGKAFTRRDTLRRHVAVHGQSAVRDYDESRLKARRRSAVCSCCAKAKQACDGLDPCGRCQKKQAVCSYGTNRSGQPAANFSPASLTAGRDGLTSRTIPVPVPVPQDSLGITEDEILSYSIAESQQTSRHTLPEGVDASVTHRSEVNPLDTPLTVDILQDMDLDSFLLDNPPEPLFSTFDLTSFILWQSDGTPTAQQETAASCRRMDDLEATPGQETHELSWPEIPNCGDSDNFPDVSQEYLEAFCRPIYTHIPQVEAIQHAYLKSSEFFSTCSHGATQGPRIFLPFQLLNAFIQLYFEHFHPIWPFIHPSTLAKSDPSWILCLGIATIGSRYAAEEPMKKFRPALMNLHGKAIFKNLPRVSTEGDLGFCQSVLLRHISLAYGGSFSQTVEMSYERSLLTTLCSNRIATWTRLRGHNSPDHSNSTWENWVMVESSYWFIYSVWLFECLTKVFFDIRPQLNAEDLDVPLPEQGSLWNAADHLTWARAYEDPTRDQVSGGMSLKSAIYDSDVMKTIAEGNYGLHRIILTATLFVEESIEVQLAKSRSVDKPSNPSILARARETATRQLFAQDMTLRLRNRTEDMDPEFSLFQPRLTARLSIGGLSVMEICIYHKIQILRHVPLRRLCALTGWQASKVYIDIAERDFRLWLTGPAPAVRKCMWHAAVIFSTLHPRRDMVLWEPLCLLVGAKFIWAYLKHATLQTHSAEYKQAIRLDRLKDKAELNGWIENGFNGDVHVSGIGRLIPGECPNRVLDELVKCLLAQTGTADLASGIAKAIMRIGHGLPASD